MSKLTLLLVASIIAGIFSSHNHFKISIKGRLTNESDSVQAAEDISQEIIFPRNTSILCYFLQYTFSEKNSTVLISISVCPYQLLPMIQSGYSRPFQYVSSKEDDWLEDAIEYEYPNATKFGVIQGHEFLYHVWKHVVELITNASVTVKLAIWFLTVLPAITIFIVNKEPVLEVICLICLDSLEIKDKCTLPCTHEFHYRCVETWFRVNRKHRCPVCRNKVKSTDFHDLTDHDSADEDNADNQDRRLVLREVLQIVRQNQNIQIEVDDILPLMD